MAGKIEDTILTIGKKRTALNLRFFPQGTSNPTVNPFDSRGIASVVRNGTAGEFLITLNDTWRRLTAITATVQMATATDLVPQVATVANFGTSTAPTIILRLLAGATPTDMAANANNSVSVELVVCDSDAF